MQIWKIEIIIQKIPEKNYNYKNYKNITILTDTILLSN